MGRFDEAESQFRATLAMGLDSLGAEHAETLNVRVALAALLQKRGELTAAETELNEVLASRLSSSGDRHGAGRTYQQLGAVAMERGRFDEAERHFRQALDVMLEFGDRHGAGRTYQQLGAVAMERGRFDEAERHFRQALDVMLEFGDRHGAGRTYQQLGAVAMERGRFDEAERYFRQALDVMLEFGDRRASAVLRYHLGVVAHRQGRLDEAERYFRQALDVMLEFGDRRASAVLRYHLGVLAQALGRYLEAERSYRQTLEIELEFGDRHAAVTQQQLGATLLHLGQTDEGIEEILRGAVALRQLSGAWQEESISLLRSQRHLLDFQDSRSIVEAVVPLDLIQELRWEIGDAES